MATATPRIETASAEGAGSAGRVGIAGDATRGFTASSSSGTAASDSHMR
jgi:hypothetical protein